MSSTCTDPPGTLSLACTTLATSLGDRTAFRFEEESVGFAELDRRADRIAAALRDAGIGPGDRVAILAKDSLASYEVLFGAARARAVLVPINWRLSPKEAAYIVADSGSKFLFTSVESISRLRECGGLPCEPRVISLDGPAGGDSYESWRDRPRAPVAVDGHDEEDPVVQVYTSGTTGHPKGVVLPNRTFFHLLRGMRAEGDVWMDLGAGDRLLLSLPQFHIGGLWWAVQGYLAGATGIVIESFQPTVVIELIQRWRITKVPLVPAMIQFVLAEPASISADFSSVTGLLYGGSPISPALLERAMDLFRCDFFQIYGLTETGNMAVCLRPKDHARGGGRLLSAGRPLPGVEAKVIGPDGRRLSPGMTGEICLKSPSRMIGYWNDAEATRATLVNGWIHTGDAGYLDEEGYLFVTDRIKDLIIYAGENVSPAEVEAALRLHPAVQEAAVVGAPDDRWGEIIRAFVVLRPGESVKAKDLSRFARGHLADFKVPRSFEFVDSLPRNPSGKLLRRELRSALWQGRGRLVN
ncbi:long-chain-fatty-acid--CoA ligase [Aquisphaera insulae]|uniref:long-chain-fatty-acid--CoA ligase n=1 Tax=Aquisphaera insulae TaxID=2712864 RepID=UPI0013EBC34A|nr:long-chain-fatty-acid--CoA ligase [Aquisphaera insulae]